MTANIKGRKVAIIGLGICLFTSALSWMLMRVGSIWAELDFETQSMSSWIVSGYILFEVAVIPLAGKLSDHLGERRIVLIGTSIFIIGALACSISTSMIMLVFFRCIEGIGAGFMFSLAFTAAGTLYGRDERGKAHEVMTAAFAVGSLYGTMVGYWFTFNISWRVSFLLSAVLMLVGGILAYRALPERETKGNYDIIGMVMFSTVMFLAMFYTQIVNDWFPLVSMESGALVCLIVALSLIMYILSKRKNNPAFPSNMRKVQAKSILTMFLVGLFGIGIIQFVMKMFLIGYNLDIYEASLMFLFLLLGGACTSIAGCRWVHFTGARIWVVVGSGLLVYAYLILYFIGETNIYAMMICLVIIGMGLGCMVTELLCSIQSTTKKENMGIISSTTMSIRLLGIAVGNAIFSYYVVEHVLDIMGVTDIAFDGDGLDFINVIIALFWDEADVAIAAFDDGVVQCGVIACLSFLFILMIGLWIRKDDLVDQEGPNFEEEEE